MANKRTPPGQPHGHPGDHVLDRKSLVKAQKRGRILYRAPQGTRYTPLFVIFLIMSLALIDFHSVFIGLSLVFISLLAINFLFFSDKGFTVYEKGILIPISWYKNKLYERENIKYRRFVPFSRIEFFYPCSFKIYKNIIVPYGLTIKTPDFEYHLAHEYARVLSKKLRVAMRDDFDRLYKADYCIYRTAGDWKDVDERLSEYSSIIAKTGIAFFVLFIAITALAIGFAHLSEYPFASLDPVIQALIIIDSAIVSAFLVNKLKPGMLRDFYHATFRTWIAMERGENVPEDISKSYNQVVKKKISREADVLEIFALDRSERMSRSIVINLVILVQIMLIFSVTPPEFFFGYETDYSDSLREFPFEPLIIENDIVYENTELFVNEIVTGDHSVTIRNSTIWALGGLLFDIGPNGSIHAEDSTFTNPLLTDTIRSTGTRNVDHVMKRDVNIPAGARLEFYSKYTMDYGFDFGYVSISSDNKNWTHLEGSHTTEFRNRNADVGHKDSHAYTGTSDWIHESISLDGFEGIKSLRFNHLTDDHRYEDDGEWLLNNIRIVGKNGTEILTREGWSNYAWGSAFYRPNEYTMNIQGQASFVNCNFTSHSDSFEDLPIINLDDTNANFVDCSFNRESGPVLSASGSTIDLNRVSLDASRDFLLVDSEITIRNSEIRSMDIMFNFDDSYLIVENSTFLQQGVEIDPLEISIYGDSGILIWKEVGVEINALRPDGANASNVSVLIDPLHGGRTVFGTTDRSGYFTTPLFSGYEFAGRSTPREFFDSHLLLKADMYRITVDNTSYLRFIGEDSSYTLVAGDAPDLTPDLSSFQFELDESGNQTNLNMSIEIMNKGNEDAENVTVTWRYFNHLGTLHHILHQTNLSIPAGASVTVEPVGPDSEQVIMTIDPDLSVLELDEGNNGIAISFTDTFDHASIMAYGDYAIQDLNTEATFSILGDLVCVDGSLDISDPSESSPSLTVYGDLYLENVANVAPGDLNLRIAAVRNSYISGSDLEDTIVDVLGQSIIHASSMQNINPQSGSHISVTNSTIENIFTSANSPFIRIGNSTVSSMTMRSDNALIHDCTFTPVNNETGLTQFEGMLQLEDNTFSGYDEGYNYRGGDAKLRDNEFKDCEIGVTVDEDNSLALIDDILASNTFTDCDGKLGYYHTIQIRVKSEDGSDFFAELTQLVYNDEIENANFRVTIENDTGVVYDQIMDSHAWPRPKLLHFVVAGNGTYEYPMYHLSVQKFAYGYHYSTFSNVSSVLVVVVLREGDGMITDLQFEPIDGSTVRINASVSSIGLNSTDIEVALFMDQTQIASHTFPLVSADVPYSMHHNLTIEDGTHAITARIVSDDPFPGNNELTHTVMMVASDQTITAGSMDASIIVGDGANAQVVDGTLDIIQEKDHDHGILVLDGGSLLFRDVTIRSDHRYVLRNYGEMRIKDSTVIKPLIEYSTYLEDGIYREDSYQVANLGNDPYELELDSGVFNYGTLVIEGSLIEDGGIYSENSLTMTDSTMLGVNYPEGHSVDDQGFEQHPNHPIFATGDVTLRGCNISYFFKSVYLYQAEFVVEDSQFSNSIRQSRNLSVGENWAKVDGGILFLETQGSLSGSEFHGIGLDIRNSTVEAMGNLFTSDLFYSEEGYQVIMRNTKGTYSGNAHTFNVSDPFFRESQIVIFENCSGLVVDGNTMTGEGMGVAMISYFSSPTVTNNVFDNFSYALRSHGSEIDPSTNTMINISRLEYSHWYELNLVPDDGSRHLIDGVSIYLIRSANRYTSVRTFHNPENDALYYHDYLMEGQSVRGRHRALIWLESYSKNGTNVTQNPAYNFSVSMGSYNHIDAVYPVVTMDQSKDARVVLPLPDLGVSMRLIPDDLVVGKRKELVFTVFNNGSKNASQVWVDITILNERGYRIENREWNLDFLAFNSSIDLSHSWNVEAEKFTVTYDLRYYRDETTDTNNEYSITLTAKEAKKENKTRETTYRGLTLFFAILAMLFLGSVYIKKASKERVDAQGINFDVDEFRRSLKAVGSDTGTADDADDAEEDVLWEDEEDDGGEYEEGEDEDDAERKIAVAKRPPPPPPPPYATRVKVPGKDFCPSCHSALHGSDDQGLIACSSCGWMRYEKRIRPVVSPDPEDT